MILVIKSNFYHEYYQIYLLINGPIQDLLLKIFIYKKYFFSLQGIS